MIPFFKRAFCCILLTWICSCSKDKELSGVPDPPPAIRYQYFEPAIRIGQPTAYGKDTFLLHFFDLDKNGIDDIGFWVDEGYSTCSPTSGVIMGQELGCSTLSAAYAHYRSGYWGDPLFAKPGDTIGNPLPGNKPFSSERLTGPLAGGPPCSVPNLRPDGIYYLPVRMVKYKQSYYGWIRFRLTRSGNYMPAYLDILETAVSNFPDKSVVVTE